MGKLKRFAVVAGAALLPSACAAALPPEDVAFIQTAPSEESTLVVQNDYAGEMDVYAVTGSTRFRLGTIRGRTGTLRLPRTLLARPSIVIQLDPVGPVDAYTYPPIVITPGATIELMVAPMLTMSSYAVR